MNKITINPNGPCLNKPFCDGPHVSTSFNDSTEESSCSPWC